VSNQNVQDGPQPVKPEKRLSLIPDRELCRRLGNISSVSLWRLRKKDQRCPRPVRMMTNMNMNVEDEADAYIEALRAERDQANGSK
jgi:hypothetical protein